MMQTQILLCAIPYDVWDAQSTPHEPFSNLQVLLQDALSIERRLPKNVNLENERSRYTLCCNQIESIVLQHFSIIKSNDDFNAILSINRFPSIVIDLVYLRVLAQKQILNEMKSSTSNKSLGASLFHPHEIEQHIKDFAKTSKDLGYDTEKAIILRLSFLRTFVFANKCGIIEVPLPLIENNQAEPLRSIQTHPKTELNKFYLPSVVADEVVHGSRRTKMTQQLERQIEYAIASQDPVNASNQPHDITTDVIHEFVYSHRLRATNIRIVYADGSEGANFPVYCLPKTSDREIEKLKVLPPFRIALISMRHLELDKVVDMAWICNRDASQSRTLSEADHYCYEYSLQQFSQLEMLSSQQNGLHIHLYHMGFEPAVIAFYKAFIYNRLQKKETTSNILIIP